MRSLCYIKENHFISENGIDENRIYKSANYDPEYSKFTDEDKFLLQKLYSDDFIDQFKTYMYANYPWRYASSFINKKEHEFKAWGIVIALGIFFSL